MRLASVVLPIVRVLTLVSLVALHLFIKRAPDCLKMEHVEVGILLHLVQQVDRELLLLVGEGTQVSEVTRIYIMRPIFAKLRLILLRMIK